MYSNGLTLNAAPYKNLFSSSSGTLFVPVKPSAVIYSQFDYVRGTAASSGQNGVPINRVRILNTLINQLVAMKKKDALSKEDIGQMTDAQKDELIKTYQQQIKNAVAAGTAANNYGLTGLLPQAGTVVSISA